ncbi:CCR4-NOT transcription complex subunit 10 isoform X3 [Ooceraea biroi]|uniref:CCR4-NOT transcription complex subunit 10 isoform X3 n=1 Tax=Ooceraea biroi TaxID=2015173 RepID=UPI000F07C273|nr:CCR4-NOT transcription complex subunit 10 isoform X3 [Ooceraea biroi]
MSESAETQSKDSAVSVITEQERELAQNALLEFQKGSYASCLLYLNKLESLRPMDLKVTHNKVVVEYYKSDLKKTELMQKSLNAICGQISTMDSSEAIDDVEKCIMRYNQAVLLYHTKQYNTALRVMNKFFAFIEPMEETLAHKVCLLLIELYIVIEQPDAALSIIEYVESQFVSLDSSKIPSVDKEGITKSIKEQKEQKKDVSDTLADAFKIKLLKCKARVYLLTHQLKLCKKEWKTLVSLGTPANTSTIFLKANLEYLRGNYKKAMKLLNSTTIENLDFKLCGESSAVLYYNNVACLHLAMGKPNLACFYLQKALYENKYAVENVQVKDTDPLSQPLYMLGGNKHYELMYSLGVSLLHAGQISKAFDCFTEAAQRLHNNPKLWLRMAECCIYSHKYSNEIDFDISKRRKDLVQKVIGSGIYRKIILATSLSNGINYHTEDLSYAIPQPTLEFGSLCLKNALFLLPNNEPNVLVTNITNTQTMSLSLTSGHSLGVHHAALMSQATITECFNLKISVLAASTYISLCLGDYILAFEHAKSLLSLNKLPGAYKMLGNLYAAESLIYMDKISEALEYLKPENLQDLNTFTPISEIQEKDKEKAEEIVTRPIKKAWYPTTVSTATAILRYNLAVAYAIQGELEKSGETLKQVWMSKEPNCDIPIQVIMLALYIELQLGTVLLHSAREKSESHARVLIVTPSQRLYVHKTWTLNYGSRSKREGARTP